jgi:hypothetical protein
MGWGSTDRGWRSSGFQWEFPTASAQPASTIPNRAAPWRITGPLDWSNAPLPASVAATSVLPFSPLHRL